MSQRYEWVGADADARVVGQGTELDEDTVGEGNAALILGDPYATAFVVEGSLDGIKRFLRDALARVEWFERESRRCRWCTATIVPVSGPTSGGGWMDGDGEHSCLHSGEEGRPSCGVNDGPHYHQPDRN